MVSTTETPLEAREVAPGGLIIAANVRTDTQVDKTFVSSIKQHGVLVPILVEDVDGELHVRDGQRRVLAAIEAGLTTVPVYLVGTGTDAERIIEQIVVNDQRAELSDAEHAGAFKQLSLIGVSADSIARKTNLPKKRVELAINVSQSEVAAAAMIEHQLDLDQAAVVLEFEDDPADVAEITAAATAGQFDHVASEIRTRRKTDALIAQALAEAEAEGIATWTGTVAGYYDEKDAARRLDYLYIDAAAAQKGHHTIKPDHHRETCEHHALAIGAHWDWVGNERQVVASKTPVCTDWKASGHFERSTSSSSSKPEPGSKEADAATAARRLTIANNKLWAPSTEVRIAFIKELLQRKELPSSWERYVAEHFSTQYNPDESRNGAKKLLGIAEAESFGTWLQAAPGKGPHVLIAIALNWSEASNDFAKSGWRSPRAQAHLSRLSSWGYTLSEIEERVVQGTATQVAS